MKFKKKVEKISGTKICSFFLVKNNLFYIGLSLINNILLVSGYSRVIQLHIYKYLFFFKFPWPKYSHLGYYRISVLSKEQ